MDIASLVNGAKSSASTAAASSKAAKDAQENQDRFLTLLVAQMKNQDPMNPMENAQLTTQIAQIQTVTGVDQLNTSIDRLAAQFGQGQTLSAVGMVGRSVMLDGNRLLATAKGSEGSFQLEGAADNVKVEILTPAGTVVDTLNLGAASRGRIDFNWPAGTDPSAERQFRVIATRGAKPVAATTFSRDSVVALNTSNGQLEFELASGRRTTLPSILSVD